MGQFTLSQSAKGLLLALSGVMMFSTKSVFAKMALAFDTDVLTVLLFRVGVGFPLLLAVFIVTWLRNKHKHKDLYRDYIAVFLFAIIGYYLSSLANFEGLKYMTASAERIVLFMYPTFVLIMSSLVFKERIKKQQVFAIIVCYLGLIVAFYNKLAVSDAGDFWKGVMLVSCSAFTYAIFLTASNRYIPRIGPTMFTSIALLSASLSTFVHFLIRADFSSLVQPTGFYIICGCMSLAGTIVPAFMFNTAIKYLGASNVSIISSLGPVETMIMSAVILSEEISIIQIAGTALVITGVLILKLKFSMPKILSFRASLKNI